MAISNKIGRSDGGGPEHIAAPSELLWPDGQGRHAAGLDAPAVGLYEPAIHAMHVVRPALGPNVPAGQGRQVEETLDGAQVPSGQEMGKRNPPGQ